MEVFLRKRNKKKEYMGVNDIKIFQKMKIKNQLSIEKNIIKYEKIKNALQIKTD